MKFEQEKLIKFQLISAAEIEWVTQWLANRVKVLAESTVELLPQLMQDVEVWSNRVDEHLKQMGLVWI
uniref:Uncharacterized protein n=1 Tax=Cyanothece sp. (strain PCC 7425 / ATCC 29141) TaxID=395961 RepID=B8HMT7_CYAP4